MRFTAGGSLLVLAFAGTAHASGEVPKSGSGLSIYEVVGGEDRARFPPILEPKYVAAKSASFMKESDEVVLFRVGGKLTAAPVPVLTWHHLLSNGPAEPVFTYCILSNTASLFSRDFEGEKLGYGVVGNLYFGNAVLADSRSDSFFLQLTGEVFHGKDAGKTHALQAAVARLHWKDVAQDDSLQVVLPPRERDFYDKFFAKHKIPETGFATLKARSRTPDPRLPPTAMGFGFRSGGRWHFLPHSVLDKRETIRMKDETGEILFASLPEQGLRMALRPGKAIEKEWPLPAAVSQKLLGMIQKKAEGGEWRPVPMFEGYWYSWAALHPDIELEK